MIRVLKFSAGDKIKTLTPDRTAVLFGVVESCDNAEQVKVGAEPLYLCRIQTHGRLVLRAEHNLYERHESVSLTPTEPVEKDEKKTAVRPSVRKG